MKKELHTYIKRAGEGYALSDEERARMKATLTAYMAMKPVRSATAASEAATPAAWASRIGVLLARPRAVALALVVVLFASSAGVSYAAEGALPGDLLYAVKTNVNEPLRGALALSTSAKVAWATQVAGARVEEAATLAAEGALDPQTQAALQDSFTRHAALATARIEEEASTSPELGVEAATRFEAQLGEYRRVLTEVAKSTHASPLAALADSVGQEGERVANVRARTDSAFAAATSSQTAIAASRMRDAATVAVDTSSKLARAALDALASSSADAVAAQLENAHTTLADGEAFLRGNDAPRALDTFRVALTASEKLSVFLQTSDAIHKRTGLRISQPAAGDDGGPQGSNDDSSDAGGLAVAERAHTEAAMAPARMATEAFAPDEEHAPVAAPAPIHATAMMAAKVAPLAATTAATTTTATGTAATPPAAEQHEDAHDPAARIGAAHAQEQYLQLALPDDGGLLR